MVCLKTPWMAMELSPGGWNRLTGGRRRPLGSCTGSRACRTFFCFLSHISSICLWLVLPCPNVCTQVSAGYPDSPHVPPHVHYWSPASFLPHWAQNGPHYLKGTIPLSMVLPRRRHSCLFWASSPRSDISSSEFLLPKELQLLQTSREDRASNRQETRLKRTSSTLKKGAFRVSYSCFSHRLTLEPKACRTFFCFLSYICMEIEKWSGIGKIWLPSFICSFFPPPSLTVLLFLILTLSPPSPCCVGVKILDWLPCMTSQSWSNLRTHTHPPSFCIFIRKVHAFWLSVL